MNTECKLNHNNWMNLQKKKNSKRKNYAGKEETWMKIAKVVAERSKDPNTQVGCVIVDKNDRIISIGYNGFPNGISDDVLPWDREAENEYDTKYPYVMHAERNAILNSGSRLNDLKGATLYVTLFPCRECTKSIIQCGISRIVYDSNKYKDTDDYKEAVRMLDCVGIAYVNIKDLISK